MEIKELRKLSNEELNTKRMQHASGTLEKPVQLKQLRRDVARMKTVLKERELNGGNE